MVWYLDPLEYGLFCNGCIGPLHTLFEVQQEEDDDINNNNELNSKDNYIVVQSNDDNNNLKKAESNNNDALKSSQEMILQTVSGKGETLNVDKTSRNSMVLNDKRRSNRDTFNQINDVSFSRDSTTRSATRVSSYFSSQGSLSSASTDSSECSTSSSLCLSPIPSSPKSLSLKSQFLLDNNMYAISITTIDNNDNLLLTPPRISFTNNQETENALKEYSLKNDNIISNCNETTTNHLYPQILPTSPTSTVMTGFPWMMCVYDLDNPTTTTASAGSSITNDNSSKNNNDKSCNGVFDSACSALDPQIVCSNNTTTCNDYNELNRNGYDITLSSAFIPISNWFHNNNQNNFDQHLSDTTTTKININVPISAIRKTRSKNLDNDIIKVNKSVHFNLIEKNNCNASNTSLNTTQVTNTENCSNNISRRKFLDTTTSNCSNSNENCNNYNVDLPEQTNALHCPINKSSSEQYIDTLTNTDHQQQFCDHATDSNIEAILYNSLKRQSRIISNTTNQNIKIPITPQEDILCNTSTISTSLVCNKSKKIFHYRGRPSYIS